MSKGQSAIEYLTTYGWMLLVVAIVGGAIFTTVRGAASIQSVTGLSNADIQVDDYALSDNGLKMSLISAGQDEIKVEEVRITDPRQGISTFIGASKLLALGETGAFSFNNIDASDNSRTYDLDIVYDIGELNGLTANGQITGSFVIDPPTRSVDADGDGSLETAVYSGQGTTQSPYRVDSLVDLQAIDKNSATRSNSYSLVSDIDASPTSSWNSGKGFDPINSYSETFSGNGHTITNLTIDRPTEDNVAPFGSISSSGNLNNLLIKNVTVYGDGFVGGVVGQNSGEVRSVGVTGEVRGLQTTDALGVGGFAGDQVGTVTDSYSLADVYEDGSDSHFNARAGGFQGQGKGTTKDSFSAGEVISDDFYSGGFTGRNIGGSYDDLYWDTESSGKSGSRGGASPLTSSEMTGDSAADNMNGFDFQNVWRTVDGDYPELR